MQTLTQLTVYTISPSTVRGNKPLSPPPVVAIIGGVCIPVALLLVALLLRHKLRSCNGSNSSHSAPGGPYDDKEGGQGPTQQQDGEYYTEASASLEELNPDVVPFRGEGGLFFVIYAGLGFSKRFLNDNSQVKYAF